MKRIETIVRRYRRLLKTVSRSEWSVRLLDLPRCVDTQTGPGLIMVQVDGLALTQFERALLRGRLPFIRKLILKRRYVTKPFYSGLPSTTPAVQGELFYGVKTAVPAFEFIDRETQERHAMFYPASANRVAARLKRAGKPLLKGGSAYSHVYSGGAKHARYCAETMNLQSLARAVNPLKLISISVFHITKLFRVLGYACIELMLAVYDFFGGVFDGENALKELKFIPTRLFVCVILRELIRFRVKMDVTRGVPIVSANFFGYDEQAHRRGPGSAFAHWTLKGIDEVVKDIYRTAVRSDCRDYRLIVYSDHGQESVQDYANRYGKPVKQAIREWVDRIYPGRTLSSGQGTDNTLDHRYRRAANLLFGKGSGLGRNGPPMAAHSPDSVEITTMGPLGHVYLPNSDRRPGGDGAAPAGLAELARLFNREAKIPLVLFRHNDRIVAVNDAGAADLEKDGAQILGRNHPFMIQAVDDLKRCCLHPDAGDLVISGWSATQKPISFNVESGAHGGPGVEETRGFVLLPPDMKTDLPYMRPLDLRGLIVDYREKRPPKKGSLRV